MKQQEITSCDVSIVFGGPKFNNFEHFAAEELPGLLATTELELRGALETLRAECGLLMHHEGMSFDAFFVMVMENTLGDLLLRATSSSSDLKKIVEAIAKATALAVEEESLKLEEAGQFREALAKLQQADTFFAGAMPIMVIPSPLRTLPAMRPVTFMPYVIAMSRIMLPR